MANVVKLLTLARDLHRRKARERQGLFVAEGVRTVEELLALVRSSIRGVLVAPQLDETPAGAALLDRAPAPAGSPSKRWTTASSPAPPKPSRRRGFWRSRGAGPVARRPPASRARSGSWCWTPSRIPGNVGTIVRTAAALGVTATFSLPGTVDLWNAKVVRSGMGAHFHHPCLTGTWDDLDSFRRERRVRRSGRPTRAGESLDALDPPRATRAVVVGNEGGGLSSAVRGRAPIVSLRFRSLADVESLNVAVAAGILLYELSSVTSLFAR